MKMTDEELEKALLKATGRACDWAANGSRCGGTSGRNCATCRAAERIRAHIIALAAGRDAAVQEAKAEGEDFGFRQATECIAGRSYSATCSMDALAAAHAVAGEMHALRERVKALEAEKEQWRASRFRAAQERHAAESRLAAMRQRAGDSEALGRVSDEAWRRHDYVASAVARYIVGDNAPAPSEVVHENARGNLDTRARFAGDDTAPSELDGLRGEMAEPLRCAGCRKVGVDLCAVCEAEAKRSQDEMAEADCDVDGKGRSVLATAPAEQTVECAVCPDRGDFEHPCCNGPCQKTRALTTSEAFATVRNGLHVASGASKYPTSKGTVDAAQEALSLLERRMGAQDAAVRRLLDLHAKGLDGPAAWDALRAALTDAPPVFTLEEVESAVSMALSDAERETGWTPNLVPMVRQRLTALRR